MCHSNCGCLLGITSCKYNILTGILQDRVSLKYQTLIIRYFPLLPCFTFQSEAIWAASSNLLRASSHWRPKVTSLLLSLLSLLLSSSMAAFIRQWIVSPGCFSLEESLPQCVLISALENKRIIQSTTLRLFKSKHFIWLFCTLQLVTSSGVTLKSSISERLISCISDTHLPPTCVFKWEYQIVYFTFYCSILGWLLPSLSPPSSQLPSRGALWTDEQPHAPPPAPWRTATQPTPARRRWSGSRPPCSLLLPSPSQVNFSLVASNENHIPVSCSAAPCILLKPACMFEKQSQNFFSQSLYLVFVLSEAVIDSALACLHLCTHRLPVFSASQVQFPIQVEILALRFKGILRGNSTDWLPVTLPK